MTLPEPPEDRVRSTACAYGHHRSCRHGGPHEDAYCTCECHDLAPDWTLETS